LDQRIKVETRRIERVLTFLGDLHVALRQHLSLSVAQNEYPTLKATLEAAWTELAMTRAAFEAIGSLPRPQQLTALEAFDASPITVTLQALRQAVAPQRIQATPALEPPARSATGALGTPSLRQPIPPASPRPLGPRTGAPSPKVRALAPSTVNSAFKRDRAAPGLADRSALQGRRGFEAACRLASEVLHYVGPRLTLVQSALSTTGLPGPRRPWDDIVKACPEAARQAGIAPPMVPWVPKLAQLFIERLPVARQALVAVNQWTTARALHDEAAKVREVLERVSPAAEPKVLEGFALGRYFGAIFPLGNLHLHFKDVPHMGKLFPPRAAP
jgi:hypothetical protein